MRNTVHCVLYSRCSVSALSLQSSRPSESAGRSVSFSNQSHSVLEADGHGLRLCPPAESADPSILRIQKKRVQVLSGEKQRTQHTEQSQNSSNELFSPHVPANGSDLHSPHVLTDGDDIHSSTDGSDFHLPLVPTDGGEATVSAKPSEEELAVVDILRSVDSESTVQPLCDTDNDQQVENQTSGVCSEAESEEVNESTYSYSSLPKLASDATKV